MSLFFSAAANRKAGYTPSIKIEGGLFHTVSVSNNAGESWAWGLNTWGQLGDNTNVAKSTPVAVAGVRKTFCQINSGYRYSMGVDKNGKVWGWGYNLFGELGDASNISKSTPVAVAGVAKTFCKIGGGGFFSTAIDKNGTVWAWGRNNFGQLGDNSITNRNTPVSIVGAAKTFCEITGTDDFVLGLDKNGGAWGWGNNTYGQVGDNSITSKRTPVAVLGATKTFCKITNGAGFAAALDKNGKIWTWGFNLNGELGDATFTSKRTPALIFGGNTKTFCKISAGGSHMTAIDKNGKVWSWGYGFYGQLGNNDTISINTPVNLLGTNKTFCDIFAHTNTTHGVDKNGKVWGWGYNTNGELGDNTILSRRTPVLVCRF